MKKMFYVTVACAVIFLSCKKDEADSVTPDSTMLTREHLYPENGFISGIIKGKTLTKVSFEKAFNHQLDLETASYSVNADGNYMIHLLKADKYGSIGGEDKRTEMRFILKKDLTRVTSLVKLHTSIYVDSTANSRTKFDVDSKPSTDMEVSNVTFDLTTGMLKADYSIKIMEMVGFTLKEKVSMVGKIDVKLINVHYREEN